MTRYAAKLLFQLRVVVEGNAGKQRVCEERIINFDAKSPRTALTQAKRYGKESEYLFKNSEGNEVKFQFIGVLDLLNLGTEADARTVWYDVKKRMTPMERRDKLLPAERELLARPSGKA